MNSPLFEVKDIDKEFYETRLRDWLPEKMIDIHVHLWLDRFRRHAPGEFARVVSWPMRVAKENSIEDLIETYKLMFPDKQVSALVFPSVKPCDDLEASNAYASECSRRYPDFPSLIWGSPDWSADEFEQRIIDGGFLGAKLYLNWTPAYLPRDEIRIFDYFKPHLLEVLDRHGWIAMLHIPRSGRLGDPVNLHQMLEIEQRYPNVKLVIAHVGRAYCDGDVGDAFEFLKPAERMLWDFSANTNSNVFRQLIEAVGPRRILFGSDMPILRMRMKRIEENGIYVNLVPPGLYGDVSGDPNMREVSAEEGEKLTFFMYEELDAFHRAAEATGLGKPDLEDIFYNNARGLLEEARN